jgi:pyruvate dehydrogenase E1 component alpha subunit
MNPNPVLIEALTHRQIGHWVGDSQKYRTLEEIESLPKYDPLRIFRNRIGIRSDISRENLEEIESKVINEIKDAAIFADNSPYAPLEEAIKDYIKE